MSHKLIDTQTTQYCGVVDEKSEENLGSLYDYKPNHYNIFENFEELEISYCAFLNRHKIKTPSFSSQLYKRSSNKTSLNQSQYLIEFFNPSQYNNLKNLERSYIKYLSKNSLAVHPDKHLRSIDKEIEQSNISYLNTESDKKMIVSDPMSKREKKKPNRAKKDDASTLKQIALTWSEIPKNKRDTLVENQVYLTAKNGRGVFVCDLCGYDSTSLPSTLIHCSRNSHKESLQTELIRNVIYYLPPISNSHYEALEKYLDQAIQYDAMDPDEILRRKSFAQSVINALNSRVKNLNLVGSGSTYYGLSSRYSIVDIVCSQCNPNDFDPETAYIIEGERGLQLNEIYDLLNKISCSTLTRCNDSISTSKKDDDSPDEIISNTSKSTNFEDTDKRLTKFNQRNPKLPKMPQIYDLKTRILDKNLFSLSFFDSLNVKYVISVDVRHMYNLTKLVDVYLRLSDDCVWLARAFMKFCKMAYLVSPDNDTMPPICAIVMVIFYLQHCRPYSLLPNIQDLYQKNKANLAAEDVYKVMDEGCDYSFINNIEKIKELWNKKPLKNFSENSFKAYDYYLSDISNKDDKVILLHIVQPVGCSQRRFSLLSLKSRNDYFNLDEITAMASGVKNEWHKASKEFLKLIEKTKSFGISNVNSEIRLSLKPANTILEACSLYNANMIVIGQCGLNGFQLKIMGSVTISVLHQSKIPYEIKNIKWLRPKLWLGLLRFFIFDFVSVIYKLSIRSSTPVLKTKTAAESRMLMIENPFSPKLNLLSSLPASSFKYILQQMIAAYAYFGVPRLACNGRHIFTKVSIIRPNSDTSPVNNSEGFILDKSMSSPLKNTNNKRSRKNSNDSENISPKRFHKEIHNQQNDSIKFPIVPFIDDTDEFQSNLTKVNNEISATFFDLNKSEESAGKIEDVAAVLDDPSCEANLVDMMPSICQIILKETFDDSDVKIIVKYLQRSICAALEFNDSSQISPEYCHLKQFLLEHEKCNSTIMCEITRNTAYNFWRSLNTEFIQIGLLKISLNQIQRTFLMSLYKALIPSQTLTTFEQQENLTLNQKEEKEESQSFYPNTYSKIKNLEEELNQRSIQRVSSITYLMKQVTNELRASLPTVENEENMPIIPWDKCIIETHDTSLIVDDENIDHYHSIKVNSVNSDELSFPLTAAGVYHGINITSSILGLSYCDRPSTLLAHFQPPKPVCSACGSEGHRNESCQKDSSETIALSKWQMLKDPFIEIDINRIDQLTDALIALNKAHLHLESQSVPERLKLIDLFKKRYGREFKGIHFELFGSCANGFGSKTSDLDICVTFPADSQESRLASSRDGIVSLIQSFRTMMYKLPEISYVSPITSAKVPILKFGFSNGLQGDISFNNLAVYNTRLVAKYVELEPRFQILGHALKTIVKGLNINDASAGSISSYAYILMLIHYLQQKNVLPVLQEMYDTSRKPCFLVDGWNVWFQSNNSKIEKMWTQKNSDSVGQLWVGFFQYYLFEFDRENYVICIRKSQLLSRLGKLWSSHLAIEDPFNLNHNLTNSLNRGMFNHILNALFNAYNYHLTTPIEKSKLDEWNFSIFSADNIRYLAENGSPGKKPPKLNHACHRCYKLGHKAKDCLRGGNWKKIVLDQQNESRMNDELEYQIVNRHNQNFHARMNQMRKSHIRPYNNQYNQQQRDGFNRQYQNQQTSYFGQPNLAYSDSQMNPGTFLHMVPPSHFQQNMNQPSSSHYSPAYFPRQQQKSIRGNRINYSNWPMQPNAQMNVRIPYRHNNPYSHLNVNPNSVNPLIQTPNTRPIGRHDFNYGPKNMYNSSQKDRPKYIKRT